MRTVAAEAGPASLHAGPAIETDRPRKFSTGTRRLRASRQPRSRPGSFKDTPMESLFIAIATFVIGWFLFRWVKPL